MAWPIWTHMRNNPKLYGAFAGKNFWTVGIFPFGFALLSFAHRYYRCHRLHARRPLRSRYRPSVDRHRRSIRATGRLLLIFLGFAAELEKLAAGIYTFSVLRHLEAVPRPTAAPSWRLGHHG